MCDGTGASLHLLHGRFYSPCLILQGCECVTVQLCTSRDPTLNILFLYKHTVFSNDLKTSKGEVGVGVSSGAAINDTGKCSWGQKDA